MFPEGRIASNWNRNRQLTTVDRLELNVIFRCLLKVIRENKPQNPCNKLTSVNRSEWAVGALDLHNSPNLGVILVGSEHNPQP